MGKSFIRFWDVAGDVIESATTTLYTKYVNVIVFVYDLTDVSSFRWLEVIMEALFSSSLEKWTATLLIGNKVDLVDDTESSPRMVLYPPIIRIYS